GETQTGKTGQEELSGAIRMVENMEAFNLDCFALIQDGKIIGVTVGKKTGQDTYTVFVEKALTEGLYVGAYPLLAGLSAQEALSQKLTKINRMDDEGEAHLRKAKQALNPSERPPVYRVTRRNLE
ncbi:MAG: phosphatidylglycerol lysyltransferase domain-containing protein, partial [Deltaproteobacteria bacterium]